MADPMEMPEQARWAVRLRGASVGDGLSWANLPTAAERFVDLNQILNDGPFGYGQLVLRLGQRLLDGQQNYLFFWPSLNKIHVPVLPATTMSGRWSPFKSATQICIPMPTPSPWPEIVCRVNCLVPLSHL